MWIQEVFNNIQDDIFQKLDRSIPALSKLVEATETYA